MDPVLKRLRGDVPSREMTKIPRTQPVVRAILDYAMEEHKQRIERHRELVRRLCR